MYTWSCRNGLIEHQIDHSFIVRLALIRQLFNYILQKVELIGIRSRWIDAYLFNSFLLYQIRCICTLTVLIANDIFFLDMFLIRNHQFYIMCESLEKLNFTNHYIQDIKYDRCWFTFGPHHTCSDNICNEAKQYLI